MEWGLNVNFSCRYHYTGMNSKKYEYSKTGMRSVFIKGSLVDPPAAGLPDPLDNSSFLLWVTSVKCEVQ